MLPLRLLLLVQSLSPEYVLLPQKLAWIRAHCVQRALTVHHHAARFEANTSTPFTRIWFGVNVAKFAAGAPVPAEAPPKSSSQYEYDVGFTGVIRADQTANWRYRIWREAWPRLRASGLRLFAGGKGSVHVGVAHAALNSTEYVHAMRASRMWLSTTGPADLVGTRYFEVMATGTTLCVCNRLADPDVYGSLGIRDGVHVAMFSTLSEFESLVANFSRPEHEARRLAIVRRAQALALRKFSWEHVADRVEGALRAAAAPRGGKPSSE